MLGIKDDSRNFYFRAEWRGKSTLTHALAKQIGCFEMDVEDYYFPEHRESRKYALEITV